MNPARNHWSVDTERLCDRRMKHPETGKLVLGAKAESGRLAGVVDISGFAHHLPGALKINTALGREQHAARRSLQEPHTQFSLKRRQLPGHRRQGHLEPLGRRSEAAGFDDGGENLQGAKPVHGRILSRFKRVNSAASSAKAGAKGIAS